VLRTWGAPSRGQHRGQGGRRERAGKTVVIGAPGTRHQAQATEMQSTLTRFGPSQDARHCSKALSQVTVTVTVTVTGEGACAPDPFPPPCGRAIA